MIVAAKAIAATKAVEDWYLSKSGATDAKLALYCMVGAEAKGSRDRYEIKWPNSRGWVDMPDPLAEIGATAELARRVDRSMLIPLDPGEACLLICYRALGLSMPGEFFPPKWDDIAWSLAALLAITRPMIKDNQALKDMIATALGAIPDQEKVK